MRGAKFVEDINVPSREFGDEHFCVVDSAPDLINDLASAEDLSVSSDGVKASFFDGRFEDYRTTRRTVAQMVA